MFHIQNSLFLSHAHTFGGRQKVHILTHKDIYLLNDFIYYAQFSIKFKQQKRKRNK